MRVGHPGTSVGLRGVPFNTPLEMPVAAAAVGGAAGPFNTPLEMRIRSASVGACVEADDFQYSIGDAVSIIETQTGEEEVTFNTPLEMRRRRQPRLRTAPR